MAKSRIEIGDLDKNAMADLSESEVNKVTGGIAILADSDVAFKTNLDTSAQLFEAWPSKWKGFSLDGKGGDV